MKEDKATKRNAKVSTKRLVLEPDVHDSLKRYCVRHGYKLTAVGNRAVRHFIEAAENSDKASKI